MYVWIIEAVSENRELINGGGEPDGGGGGAGGRAEEEAKTQRTGLLNLFQSQVREEMGGEVKIRFM